MDLKYEPRNFKFNKTANSNDLNEMNKELSHDFYQIYKELSQQSNNIDELLDMFMINNQVMQNKVSDLEQKLDDLDTEYYYVNFYNTSEVSFGEDIELEELADEDRCMYEPDYNSLMLNPISVRPKTYLRNIQDDIIVPDDLRVNIYDDVSGNILENDIENAFNQELSDAWIRKYIFSDGEEPASVEIEVEIEIPKSIITNMFANSIFISPFPKNTIDINNIEYSTPNSGGYDDIENFDIVENANNLVVTFEEKQISHIKITMEQDKSIEVDNGDRKLFAIGAQNIAIYNNRYSLESKAYVKFEPHNDLEVINSIEPILSFGDEESVDIKVYGVNIHDDTMLTEIEIGEPISYNYNEKFFIETTLHKEIATFSPVLQGYKIDADEL